MRKSELGRRGQDQSMFRKEEGRVFGGRATGENEIGMRETLGGKEFSYLSQGIYFVHKVSFK